MKKVLIIISALAISSCQSEAGKKADMEVAKAEKELKRATYYRKCVERKSELVNAGMSEEDAAKKTDEIDPECHCLDSLKSGSK